MHSYWLFHRKELLVVHNLHCKLGVYLFDTVHNRIHSIAHSTCNYGSSEDVYVVEGIQWNILGWVSAHKLVTIVAFSQTTNGNCIGIGSVSVCVYTSFSFCVAYGQDLTQNRCCGFLYCCNSCTKLHLVYIGKGTF